ncbi:hypothetical protein EV363DRAFT_1586412 [Boletus edulis]|nr:hypothetical protein EV363DRAFT_1586412 [Boletus edulis]
MSKDTNKVISTLAVGSSFISGPLDVAPTNNASLLLNTFIYIIFDTLIPRFIISIRELYDRDIRDRFHIDTGLGALSRSDSGLDTTMSAMAFVDGNQDPEVEGSTDNSKDLENGS